MDELVNVVHVHLGKDSDRHPIIDNYARTRGIGTFQLIGSTGRSGRIARVLRVIKGVIATRAREIAGKQRMIWHVHDPMSCLLVRMTGTRDIVFDVHEDYGSFGGSPFTKGALFLLQQLAMQSARWLFFPSRFRQLAAGCGNRQRVAIVENRFLDDPGEVMDLASRRLWSPGCGRPLVVAYAGTIRDGRGIEHLLAAADLCPEGSVELQLAGSAAPSWVEMMGSRSFVRYLGSVGLQEARSLVAGADLSFATYEPTSLNNWLAAPTKLFELTALGVPCAVNSLPYIDQLVNEGFTHLIVFPSVSVDAIADMFARILSGHIQLTRPADSAVARADWKGQVLRIQAAYDDLHRRPDRDA